MNLKTIEYCLGHIDKRCKWCCDCLPDFVTGNERNKECKYYEAIELHILDKPNAFEQGMLDARKKKINNQIPKTFYQRYGDNWRNGE